MHRVDNIVQWAVLIWRNDAARKPGSNNLMAPSSNSKTSSPVRKLAESFGFQPVSEAGKQRLVSGVFDNVASSYDVMNDVMSLGIHRLWKEALIDWLAPRPGIKHLDVAGGTGDIALRLLDRVHGDGQVTLVDINAAMLAAGRDKAIDQGRLAGLDWVVGDAQKLPVPDASYHSYTIAFGIRNVPRIDVALAEAYRALRPGGRFLCLEFSQMAIPALRDAYDAYSFNVVPWLGQLVAKDRDSYQYLVESIRQFPEQRDFAKIIADAGFSRVSYRNLSGGIAAIHSGWRL